MHDCLLLARRQLIDRGIIATGHMRIPHNDDWKARETRQRAQHAARNEQAEAISRRPVAAGCRRRRDDPRRRSSARRD
jgi:hypothetical protein